MAISPLNAAFVRIKYAGDPTERQMTIAEFISVLEAQGIDGASALTYTGIDPNIPENITITGSLLDRDGGAITTPIALSRTDFSEVPSWGDAQNNVSKSGALWILILTGALDTYVATEAFPSNTSPVGLYDSVPYGAGSATIVGDEPTATHLGQWCKASTAWWQWDGSAWIPRFLLNGKHITRDDANTAYFSLGVDAIGLPSTTPFP